MEVPSLINWINPFPFHGLLEGIFHFYSNFDITFCKQTVAPRSVASDLDLHCLPMSHKKYSRLIWVRRTMAGYYQQKAHFRNKIVFFAVSIVQPDRILTMYWLFLLITSEPWHGISNNVTCATSKDSDQPVHTRSLIRAFASRLSILWLLIHWLNSICTI